MSPESPALACGFLPLSHLYPNLKISEIKRHFFLRGEGKETLDYSKSPTYVQAFKDVNVLLPGLHCIICSRG